MPLTDEYPDTVVFVMASSGSDTGTIVQEPIGTAFLVGYPLGVGDSSRLYLVTAAHVVRGLSQTSVRYRRTDGTPHLVAVDRWYFHPTEDIAIAPAIVDYTDITRRIETTSFLDVHGEVPMLLGAPVYFIGLLHHLKAMTIEGVPMVRSGTIGRLWQKGVPVWDRRTKTLLQCTAHLIDCRSYEGFSGSPCFVQDETVISERMPDGQIGFGIRYSAYLLGVITGHVNDRGVVRSSSDDDDEEDRGWVPTNAGVAAVTPCEFIRELLEAEEELVQEREELATNLRAQDADPTDGGVVEADSITPQKWFAREDFMRDLSKVTQREAPPEQEG